MKLQQYPELASFFSDLSLFEYASIVGTVLRGFKLANAPKFTTAHTFKIIGYYKIRIDIINISANNLPEILEQFSTKNPLETPGILLTFGDIGGLNDYLRPISTGVTDSPMKTQVEHYYEQLLMNYHPTCL